MVGTETAEPEDLLDYLYSTLVEEPPEQETLRVAELSESAIARVGITGQITRNYAVPIKHERFTDTIVFDYRYLNGRPHLMQRVSLATSDQRSWDYAHASAWSFEKGHEIERDASLVALVKSRPADPDLERQLLLLEEYASVVDVGDPDRAASQLRELLHVV